MLCPFEKLLSCSADKKGDHCTDILLPHNDDNGHNPFTLKVLQEIFCGKAKTNITKRRKIAKHRQKNNGTTASNKEQGKCFWKFPAQPGELFINVMPYI